MAIRLIDRYPSRADPASSDYPHGKGRNKSDPTADDGTPFDQARFNDQEAFFQSLVEAAGITPSGVVDTVQQSDYINALLGVARGVTDVDVGGSVDVTLTLNDSRMAAIRAFGTLSANIAIEVPDTARYYLIINDTGGSFTLTVKTATGTGVEVPQGKSAFVFSDGANVRAVTDESGGGTTAKYLGFYNGQDGVNPQMLGRSVSRDGVTFERDTAWNTPAFDVTTAAYGASYGQGLRAPCPVIVGDEIYLYYEGYDGTRYNIFLIILGMDGGIRRIIETAVKENTTGDEAHTVRRPTVMYTEGAATPFEMWYSGGPTTIESENVRYATSPDGFTWTAQGTLLTLGAAGTFDDTYISLGRALLIDGTYYLFYAGNDGTRWQGGYATSASPGSGFTKGNGGAPVLTPDGPNQLPISVDISGGDTTITFSSGASAFNVGAPIAINNPTQADSNELNEVQSVDSDTQITTRYKILGNYFTADNASVGQINSFSVDPQEVWNEGGTWHCIATVFQFVGSKLRESTYYATTTNLDLGFGWEYGTWPLPINWKQGVWERYSAENLKRVKVS